MIRKLRKYIRILRDDAKALNESMLMVHIENCYQARYDEILACNNNSPWNKYDC